MDNNLGDLLNFFAKESKKVPGSKRHRNSDISFENLDIETKKNIIHAELKILCLNEIYKVITNLEIEKNNMTNRSINKIIVNIIKSKKNQLKIFKTNKIVINDDLNDEMKEYTKKSILAILMISIEILEDLKLKNYNKDFKILDYIKKLIEDQTLIFFEHLLPPSKKQRTIKTNDKDEESDELEELEELEQPSKRRKVNKPKNIHTYFDEEDESEYKSSDEESESSDEELVLPETDEETDKINKEFMQELEKFDGSEKNVIEETLEYFCNIKDDSRNIFLEKIKKINETNSTNEPFLIRLLNSDIDSNSKSLIISRIQQSAQSMDKKLKNWVNYVNKIPFGIYKGTNIKDLDTNDKKKKFLQSLKAKMDQAVYGHNDAKKHIVQVMAEKLTNTKSTGNVMGLYGVPGNGKTSLIKEGIAKVMDRPFIFISLGGATDASFLEGHDYTYEGSLPGRIIQGLIEVQCMNPIIYFDELDKISQTQKGEEIANLLVHMIDPVQNCFFKDKYFHGINFDLSKCTFIFSFNHLDRVNPILMDRITKIKTKFLSKIQKKIIGKNYLLPTILKEIGLNENDIKLSDQLIENIIENYTREGGVRGLKKIISYLIREINLIKLIDKKFDDKKIKYPIELNENNSKVLLKDFDEIKPDKIHKKDKVGLINGMWAGSLGFGGVLPIETIFIPSKTPFFLKATGSLEKVIKESTEVAYSVAWSKLSKKKKNKLNKHWETNPEGVHIHCPEGAIPKDGPSAGTALTIAIYSLMTNKTIPRDIAITGEINLQGDVMKIGGLEEKLTGAKKAGITKAFIPLQNKDDLIKIRERDPKLFNNFKVKCVEHVDEIMSEIF